MKETVFDLSEIDSALKVAESAARDAGAYLVKQLGHATATYQKSSNDDLLDSDLEAEHIILTKLRKETPYIGILSEEAGSERTQDKYWIVDPLDGSSNFLHGNPAFAVAIALAINKETVAGIIYLPTSNELFTAIRGQGAYLNKRQISVSQITELNHAIVHVGDFTKEGDPQTTANGLKDFSALISKVHRIRMLGTAAADLAYVACGRADALINHATHPWDIEAGKLLLTEAGGRCTTINRTGKPLSIYSNKDTHQALKDLFSSKEL